MEFKLDGNFILLSSYNEVIAIKFCICHYSCTLMACAIFCSNMIPCNWVTLKPNFHWIWITMEKWFVKWAPGAHYTSCCLHACPWTRHHLEMLSLLLALCEGTPMINNIICLCRVSNAKYQQVHCCWPEQAVGQRDEFAVMEIIMKLMWCHCNAIWLIVLIAWWCMTHRMEETWRITTMGSND